MDFGIITFVFVAALVLGFYFLPVIIAGQRDSQHYGAIFWVNLLFGWTILGWLAALIWACTERTE
jgi:hypothetical protein